MSDLLSALNTNGSGLNITELASSLAKAETEPRREIVEGRIEDIEVSISAMAEARAVLEDLENSMKVITNESLIQTNSASSAITATVTDASKVETGSTNISVVALAKEQVLQFQGFSGEDAVVQAGTINIDFGVWTTDDPPVFYAGDRPQVNMNVAEGTTLRELVTQFDNIDGIEASIIDVGDGTFTMGILSETGGANGLNFTVVPATSGTSSLSTVAGLTAGDSLTDTQIAAGTSLDITGPSGAATITTTAGMSAKDLAAAINANTATTGVDATAVTNAKLSGLTAATDVSFSLNGTAIGPVTIADTTDLTGLRDAINAQTGLTGISAAFGDTNGEIILTDSAGNDIELTGFDTSVDDTGLTIESLNADGTATGLTATLLDTTGPVNSAFVTGQVQMTSTTGSFSVADSVTGSTSFFSAASNASTEEAVTGADINLSAFDLTGTIADHQVRGASDAVVEYNGITVYRSSNEINDLIDGVTLELNDVTGGDVAITTEIEYEEALARAQVLVAKINETMEFLNEKTSRGILDGAEPGDLAGESTIEAVKSGIRSMLRTGITGFGNETYYLSDFGISQKLDGTLELDEDAFEKVMTESPEKVMALFESQTVASDPSITIAGSPPSGADTMTQSFRRDPVTGAAYLGQTELTSLFPGVGMTFYLAASGEMSGISLTVPDDVNAFDVTHGRSWSDTLLGRIQDALSGSNAMASRETALQSDLTSNEEELDVLDTKYGTIEARYLERFTAMETMITQLNNTGDYITSLLDAWAAETA
ncbi:flagellar filament capping protein FliD [Thalassovita mangrovi]|uniref:Flagellar hook-associated protein 2 n=1 Tax=Thalassovita mangrovi TaxID=2692236 RepID=A0A6L8LH94_9RHOB|nr:flagellar filament capping protein FliD [Thalassovita mangrovi]MYM53730.1 flagellar filament capping protein FliD [Thalassovita mangrovi]